MSKVELSLEFLEGVLGTTPGSLAELLKSADGSELTTEQVESALKPKFSEKITASFQEGRKQGLDQETRKAGEKFSKEIQEKYGLEKRLPVMEAIEAVLESKKSTFKADPKDIRNSDIYIADIKEREKKIKALEDSIEAGKKEAELKEIESEIDKATDSVLKGYALPEHEEMRKSNIDAFRLSIRNGVVFNREEGKITIYDKDGAVIRNDMQDPVDLEAFIAGRASKMFVVAKDGERRMPGRPAGDDPDTTRKFAFKSSEEYVQQLNRETDPKTREAMSKSYDAAVASGAIKD